MAFRPCQICQINGPGSQPVKTTVASRAGLTIIIISLQGIIPRQTGRAYPSKPIKKSTIETVVSDLKIGGDNFCDPLLINLISWPYRIHWIWPTSSCHSWNHILNQFRSSIQRISVTPINFSESSSRAIKYWRFWVADQSISGKQQKILKCIVNCGGIR
jgi:hypothetical protein